MKYASIASEHLYLVDSLVVFLLHELYDVFPVDFVFLHYSDEVFCLNLVDATRRGNASHAGGEWPHLEHVLHTQQLATTCSRYLYKQSFELLALSQCVIRLLCRSWRSKWTVAA